MTSPASAAEHGPLLARHSRDGSFSLWSEAFREGFHCAAGAVAEAEASFVAPSQLERFAPGSQLTVLEVAVGTGTNTAALLAAARSRGLRLRWWGLEIDPRPRDLALAEPAFRCAWPAPVLADLEALLTGPTLLWGDARRRLPELPGGLMGACDLVLHDAFSPRRCPELWTREFLDGLARRLAPQGRLISYSSAAAYRASLRALGLKLAAIRRVPGGAIPEGFAAAVPARWSGGTAASPSSLATGAGDDVLRPLSPMEEEHLRTRAAADYRDPGGRGTAAEILAERLKRQATMGGESSSAWRRRWGLERDGAGLGPADQAR
ncbi:MAG: MnmC family methyltransferase [Synechococcaceae cyanobacterium]|nr:MnmC family methyltransferase [Synechococcaceae cyanobacterium]